MQEVKRKLQEFIQEEARATKKDIIEVIKKYGFERIFPEYDKSDDIKQWMSTQKVKKYLFIHELRQIISGFQDIILVKGLWYQDKYYGEQMRYFNDIDLFVQESDFARFDRTMKANKFVRLYENAPVSNKYFYYNDVYDNTKLSIEKMNHYTYRKEGQSWLKVEVHIYLLPFYRYPKIQYRDIFNRREQSLIFGKLKIQVLECNDDFIYAACHMCKHLVNAIVQREEAEGGNELLCGGNYVYDLASIVNARALEWNIIINRAVEWDVIQDVLIACKLINHFFSNMISIDIIEILTEMAEKDKERGLYKSLLRDIALLDVPVIFSRNILDYVNANQINPYCNVVYIQRKRDSGMGTEILRCEQGIVYSEWDPEYWYIVYEPMGKKHTALYLSIVCSLYDIHAVTIFAENEGNLKLATRSMKFGHQESPDWIKGIQIKQGKKGQYMINVAFDILKIDIIKSGFIGCQMGIMVFNEENEVVERISLFGKGYYHFYDMGVIKMLE